MHWLLLRGLAREQRHWLSFPAALEHAAPGDRVHLLDLPGAGTEHARTSPTSILAIAEDVRARWLALREEHVGPWCLLGMSLGGMVAMAWASAHPNDFARVVLASTSAGDLSPPWRRFGLRVARDAVRSLAEGDAFLRERHIVSISTRLVEDKDAIAREWARFPVDRPMTRANVVRQLLAARAFRAPTHLEPETLVIAGGGDLLTDLSCARMLSSQLGARVSLHPSAGHELALDAPDWFASELARFSRAPARAPDAARAAPYDGSGTLPFVISPGGGERSLDALLATIALRHDELEGALVRHGALLFRGYGVTDAPGFERVAKAIGPALGNKYLGTSPRNALTEYTFSASELPPHYPIPQHCEMSFLASPPKRIFFACLVPNEGPGGETPLADFRAVLRDLDPSVRRRFEAKGVRNVRNYAGPDGGAGLDLWKLKRWDEMFHTTDRAEVERIARESGFEPTWRPGGNLRLVNVQPATKKHPTTGEAVWFNHAQVFHLSAVPAEYRRIAERQGQVRYGALARVASALVRVKALTTAEDDHAMHCTYGDGTAISDADMDAVRDAIWKNMVFFKWRRGDVLVLDNDSVSHGRMPYQGPRSVAVAWS